MMIRRKTDGAILCADGWHVPREFLCPPDAHRVLHRGMGMPLSQIAATIEGIMVEVQDLGRDYAVEQMMREHEELRARMTHA